MTDLSTKSVICRKPHVCEWCGEKINLSEPAISRAYVWEGEFNSSWQHPECHTAMNNSPESLEGFELGDQCRGLTMSESEK